MSAGLLLAGARFASAVTYTWDGAPTKNPTVGSDGSGGTAGWDLSTANFSNGTTDVVLPATGASVRFGVSTSTGAAGSVTVSGAHTVTLLRFLAPVGGGAYTFVPDASNSGSIFATTLQLNNDATINVPVAANTITFNTNAGKTLTLGGGSMASGTATNLGNAGITITGDTTANALSATIALTAGTYNLNTLIGIGSGAASTGGMQVGTGVTLSVLPGYGVGGATANLGASGLLTVSGLVNSAVDPATNKTGGFYIGKYQGTSPTLTSNLVSRMIVNGGTFTPANQIYIGSNFGLAASNVFSETAELDVQGGGTVTLQNPTSGSVILNSNSNIAGATGSAVLNISGGILSTGLSSGIALNGDTTASTIGSSSIIMSGGSLYVGSRGIVNVDTSGAAGVSIAFSGGILGALNTWSSVLPMSLTGNLTIRTADTNGAAHPITLSGVLSGSGGITKNGIINDPNSVLTLSGANTYTGATAVNSGMLALSSTGSINQSASVTVFGTAILQLGNPNSLNDSLTLQLNSGSTLNLLLSGQTEVIGALVVNGTTENRGTYSITQLQALDPSVSFTGSGFLQVGPAVPEPRTTAFIVVAVLGIAATRLSRRQRTVARGRPS